MNFLRSVLLTYLLLHFFALSAQEKYTLSGIVSEKRTGETLIGVNIIIPELNTGTTTNEYGFYSITLPSGSYNVVASYLGFQEISKKIDLNNNIRYNFELSETIEALDEVEVIEDVEKLLIRKPEMSINKLSIATIKQIPVVFGEVDVVKSVLLLPGVTNAGEGASGFNVRGGAADQNLIQLDEATIFNSSHLFGLFSVFNPDAIKDLKLFKGGIPARYGGRVSSVLDIYQKEGNKTAFHMNGGIGAISSRLLLEGPLPENGSFLAAGRASYAHLFLKLTDNPNAAYFYDLNTKLSYRINTKNSLYLSAYFGRDVFSINDSFVNTYGNSFANLRWNHLFSDKLFSNLSLIYSDYFYGLKLDFVGFKWNSGVTNFNVKYDLKHYITDNFQINYGLSNIYYKFNPGEIVPSSSKSGINKDKLIDKYANESALYIDVAQQLSSKIALQYGLRWSNFIRLGQESLNQYSDDMPVVYNPSLQVYEKATPTGSSNIKRNKKIKTYNHWEPRISIAYSLNESTSLKASYNRLSQYLHLISNTSSPTPLDVWAPSGKYIKPQLLDQVAVGFFKTLKDNAYSLEIEAYYKEIKNRLDYIDGADLIANDAIEQVLLRGEARAYGLELLLKKSKGALTGWFSYTLSKSEQRSKGITENDPGINSGNWYLTPYDKTHDLSISSQYKLSKKWKFGANFLFQTGQPVTYPSSQYTYQSLVIPNYGPRNKNRLPLYHRLDFSAIYTPKALSAKRWKSEWVFGIYNIYNRKNVASISFRQNDVNGNNEAIRLSIFGIVPSVAYNFKF